MTENLLNKIEEVVRYKCPICKELHERFDRAESCVETCKKLNFISKENDIGKFEWCSSCQKTVSIYKRDKQVANRLYMEIICSECNRTITFYEKE